MIFLCGIPTEPSLGLVIERLREMGAPHVVFHQRRFADARLELEVGDGEVRGELHLDGDRYRLEDFVAIYTRLMEWQLLPEVEHEPPDSPSRLHCRNLHAALMQWHELAPGRVLSRSAEIGVAYSKPMQGQLIRRHGFSIPETLVTNDPDEVRRFRERHGRVIYKSASYVRSVVNLLDEGEPWGLEAVRACPVLFQQYVEGMNLRVHTVGTRAFATSIEASAVDYRYAYLAGEEEKIEESAISAKDSPIAVSRWPRPSAWTLPGSTSSSRCRRGLLPRGQSRTGFQLLRVAYRPADRTSGRRVSDVGQLSTMPRPETRPAGSQPRVLLVSMPFAATSTPSLALGLLKAELARAGVASDVLYLNVLFAQMVGWSAYGVVERSSALLAGEQMFAHDLFGSRIPSDEEYEAEVLSRVEPQSQHELRHLRAHVASFLANCLERVPWDAYDIIGFSSVFEQNVPSLSLARRVKERFPRSVIVFGGANCEGVMGLALHRCFPFVDYVITGEADVTFPQLVLRLASGDRVDKLRGVVYRRGGVSVDTGPPEKVVDLDALPFPDFHDYFDILARTGAPRGSTGTWSSRRPAAAGGARRPSAPSAV